MSRSVRDRLVARMRQAARRLPYGIRRRLRRLLQPHRVEELELVCEALAGTDVPRVLIDVGAHHGSSLEPFLESGFAVFAFEPDGKNREVLARRFSGHPRLRIDPRAVSDAVGVRRFFVSPVSTGISSLHAFDASHAAAGEVATTTLAAVADELSIVAVGCLKVDAEGHDLFVMRGMPWDRWRPAVVVCEFEDKKTRPLGYAIGDLAGLLEAHGYRVIVSEWYPVERYGGDHRFRRFARWPCALADPAAWGNLIAVLPETLPRVEAVLSSINPLR